MKRLSLLLLCLVGLLLAGCEEPPDFVGVWVDATTPELDGTIVTFDLEADRAIITIDNVATEDWVVAGILKKSGNTITATITQLIIGSNPPIIDTATIEAILDSMTPKLTRSNTFTYSVVGNTLTITGDLILALTADYPGGATDTLVAIRT